MVDRAVIRHVVRPVVGEQNWQRIHRAGQRLRVRQARRAKVRASAQALNERLKEEDLLLRAQQVGANRAADELQRNSGNLTWLAQHFKTDKWGGHRYTPHYQHHLARLKDQPITLLEIGIGGYARSGDGGGSLRMWKQFFTYGKIYGLDIEDKSFVDEPRIDTFQGDQSDPELLARIVSEIGRPDVIIDDGSHRPEHIIATFNVLFPLLADDGIYIVEDTQTSYWPEWGGSEDLADPDTSLAMLKRLTDGLNYEEFVDESYEPTYTDTNIVAVHFYHNLVVIKKGPNAEGTRKKAILQNRYRVPSPSQ